MKAPNKYIKLLLIVASLSLQLTACDTKTVTIPEKDIILNNDNSENDTTEENPTMNESLENINSTEVSETTHINVSELPALNLKVRDGKMLTHNIDANHKTINIYMSRVAAHAGIEPDISVDSYYKDWKINTIYAGNPVLKGQYADPDIDIFNGKYYMYCTTDGFAGWSGTVFHCFSSENLVDWKDEGIILDVASDQVPWAVGSAWAPTIEEKNGKYYFYFCAKLSNGSSSIGVAVAEAPEGPYTAEATPLITHKKVTELGFKCGQAIDPSVFTDEDGSCYLLFGNGHPTVVKLNEDMISVDWSTLKNYEGAYDFREAITVTKRNGIYHFTWSCDDTGSENYHINYGISNSIYGPIEYKYTVLAKDKTNDILGTGHHCVLSIPGTDDYYMVYHRFHTPLTTFTEGKGFHRETCIDVLSFDPSTGLMNKCIPTMEGVKPRTLK